MKFALLITLLSGSIALGGDHFVKSYQVTSNQCVVVAEGEMEWRSVGSYSIRLHELFEGDPAQPAGQLQAGLVRERDGTIEKVVMQDVDGDGKKDVVVIIKCVGSGGYLSADAFEISGKKLKLIGHVEGLGPDADCVAELKKRNGVVGGKTINFNATEEEWPELPRGTLRIR